MINPEEIAKIDQAAAGIIEIIPATMKRLYDKYLEVGFSKEQATLFVDTWLKTIAAG